MSKRVNPTGPLDAKIILIGEAPGEDEAKTGVPFIGKSGQLLTSLLNEGGITRKECYITNVVKLRPPDNNLSRLSEIGLNLHQCEQELRDELSQLNPNVIVPLGNTPLHALTGMTGISKLRGSILQTMINGKKFKIIPTMHPAALLRQFSACPLVTADFAKIKRESEFNDFRSLLKRKFILEPSFEETMDVLTSYQNADKLSFDIETTKPVRYIKCFSFAPSTTEAICVPIIHEKKVYWHSKQEKAIWEITQKLLRNKNIGKIMQNDHFERDHLVKWVGEIEGVYMDTMLAHHLCYPELPKDLGTVSSLYTNEPYHKDDAKEGNYEGLELWRYNCMDTMVTLECANALDKELASANLTNLFHGYEMPLSVKMWRAGDYGILADRDIKIAHHDKIRNDMVKAQNEVESVVGHPLNVNSPTQMKQLLYIELALKPIKVKGKTNADDEVLYRQGRKHPQHKHLFTLVSKIRSLRKLLSTYLLLEDEFPKGKAPKYIVESSDGRVHCSWRVFWTETGRHSSAKNSTSRGMNMQNIPKREDPKKPWLTNIRDIFISSKDPNIVFVIGDLSQVEARLVAYFSQDKSLMHIFEEGIDIHSQVSAWTYGIPIEQVDRKTQRNKVKHVVHGANYDIGPRTFAYKIDIPEHEAKFLLNKYHKIFPGIRIWYESLVDELRNGRTLYNPFGRKRQFFGWWGDTTFREAYANIPQGTAGDIINMAALRMDFRMKEELKFPNVHHLVLQVHDELVFECHIDDVEKCASIFKEEAEKPVVINGRSVIIPVDLEVGRDWKNTVNINEWISCKCQKLTEREVIVMAHDEGIGRCNICGRVYNIVNGKWGA